MIFLPKQPIYKLALLSILILFISRDGYTKPNNETLQSRSDALYKTCQGTDLLIKKGAIIQTSNKEPLTLVRWPWQKEDLISIVEILATGEPYRNYTKYNNDCEKGGNTHYISTSKDDNGCHIIKCGNHYLDISDTKYFIDGIEISVPQNVNNIAINNSGNLIQGSSNTKIEQAYNDNNGILNKQKNWFVRNAKWLITTILSLLWLLFKIFHKKKPTTTPIHTGIGDNVHGNKTEHHYHGKTNNPLQSPVEVRIVSFDYPIKSGLQSKLETENYKIRWSKEELKAGWEPVIEVLEDGSKIKLKESVSGLYLLKQNKAHLK